MQMTEIQPWLYLGSVEEAQVPWLRGHEITHVLSVAEEIEKDDISISSQKHLHLMLHDFDDNKRFDLDIRAAVDFIESCRKEDGKILVHCFAGINRSVTVVLFYLAIHYGYNFPNAYILLKVLRPIIKPVLFNEILLRKEPHDPYYAHLLQGVEALLL